MPAVKQKDGTWKVKKKDGTLGKRSFKTQANALAAQRGGGAKGKGKPKPKGKGKGKAVTTSGSRTIGTGRSYQGIRLTMLAISPVTDGVIAVQSQAATVSQALTALGDDVRSRPFLAHAGVLAADVVIDRSRMVGQAAALSRGSVTAWAPEVYIAVKGVDDWRSGVGVRDIHINAVARQTGYDPGRRAWDPAKMRTYRTIKHGGQLLRIGANRITLLKRLKRALQESVLRPIGATI